MDQAVLAIQALLQPLQEKLDTVVDKLDLLENKVDSLKTSVERLEKRTGFMVENQVRKFVERIHGVDFARNFDVRGLDGLANLVVRKTSFRVPPNPNDADVARQRENAADKLAEYCLIHLSDFLNMLSRLQNAKEEKNESAPVWHILSKDLKPPDVGKALTIVENLLTQQDTQPRELQMLQRTKTFLEIFNGPLKARHAKAKISLRTYTGLALSILFASDPIRGHRQTLYGERWAWHSLEFDCRGYFSLPNFLTLGEIKSSTTAKSKAINQLCFRVIVLECVRGIISPSALTLVFSPLCHVFYESGTPQEDTTKKFEVNNHSLKIKIQHHVLRHESED